MDHGLNECHAVHRGKYGEAELLALVARADTQDAREQINLEQILATLLFAQGRTDEGRRWLEQSDLAWRNNAALSQEELPAAIRFAGRMRSAQLYAYWGDITSAYQDATRAEREMREAAQGLAVDPALYSLMGVLASSTGRYQEADDFFRIARSKETSQPGSFNLIGGIDRAPRALETLANASFPDAPHLAFWRARAGLCARSLRRAWFRRWQCLQP